jgi:hypothetical protein
MPEKTDSPPAPAAGGVVVKSPPKPTVAIAPPTGELRTFEVEFNDHKATVQARDENEARAIFNDARKEWPSPRAAGWKIALK